jgi:LAO/AO transport system kinase
MTRTRSSLELVERVKAGEPAAIARLISRAEGGEPDDREALVQIYKLAGRAHIVGITGVPGSGKSALVGKLTQKLRAKGKKIGVVAVDPSSPYSGGSILGDRVRMSETATDPGVYIRSMATRGASSGLARVTLEAVDILDVAGFETIIIETVGVGQDEVEVVRASHTTVVVSAPGLGDEIQAIKAGILEIADIHVVSKCDRSDANRTLVDIKQMLMIGGVREKSGWTVPVVATSALNDSGLDELAAAIERHRVIALGEAGRQRRLKIGTYRLRKTVETLLLARINAVLDEAAPAFSAQLAERKSDPYSLAQEFIASLNDGSKGVSHERNVRAKAAR